MYLYVTAIATLTLTLSSCSSNDQQTSLSDSTNVLDVGEMLFGDKPTHDLYESKGPSWKKKMIDENWLHEESITKMYDEGEIVYDAVLNCQENAGKTTEGFDASDVEYDLDYPQILAIKSIEEMKAYEKGERTSKPKTVAYVLVPRITIHYQTDDTPKGVCEILHDERGFVYRNDSKKLDYLGRIVYGSFEAAESRD